MRKGVFVLGTDTEVGKTVVAAGLALVLRKRGLSVGVMKPIATGCNGVSGRLVSLDAAFLMEAAATDEAPFINPVRFRNPLAPSVASVVEKMDINVERIHKAYQALEAKHDFVIVEGVGGVLVPIKEDYFLTNLVELFQLPVLLVTRAQLGTINHTLLSVEALLNRGIPLAGIVMNGLPETNISLAEVTNGKVIAELSGQPLLGVLPKMDFVDVNQMQFGNLAEIFEDRIDVDRILNDE